MTKVLSKLIRRNISETTIEYKKNKKAASSLSQVYMNSSDANLSQVYIYSMKKKPTMHPMANTATNPQNL